jgi:hypothetical protein
MPEDVVRATSAAEELVECPVCGDSVPRSFSIVTEALGRICHICYRDDRILDGDDEGPVWDDDELHDIDWED